MSPGAGAAGAAPAPPGTTGLPRFDESPPASAPNLLPRPTDVPPPLSRPQGWFVLTYGPYTRHTGRGNYNAHPHLIALEWETPERWSVGTTAFMNSFSQRCWSLQVARRFTVRDRDDGFFAKIGAGFIHGYRPPHHQAVSLNYRAICPAVIPSFGYKFKGSSLHLVVYGKNAGQMLMISRDLR